MKNIFFSIAVDGGSASGKTTGSKFISKKFNFKLLSSGKLYRYLSYKIIKNNYIYSQSFIKNQSRKITLKKLNDKKLGKHKQFRATGVSVVVHSKNPFVPCSHLNVRHFEISKNKWWFGGGYDLTPYFPYADDIKLWHNNTKKMCDKHNKKYYKNFKNQCDEYFYLKHRKEKRGVGGIFFDNLNTKSKNHYMLFLEDVVSSFLESYIKIINKRSSNKYNKNHKEFQLYRRGRYVEFNLIYDRGTLFGLQSDGRAWFGLGLAWFGLGLAWFGLGTGLVCLV